MTRAGAQGTREVAVEISVVDSTEGETEAVVTAEVPTVVVRQGAEGEGTRAVFGVEVAGEEVVLAVENSVEMEEDLQGAVRAVVATPATVA